MTLKESSIIRFLSGKIQILVRGYKYCYNVIDQNFGERNTDMGCAMSIDDFRKIHSHLIEHYQFIESHLEGLYAAVCGEQIVKGLEEVEKDNIPRLINKIHSLERGDGKEYLSAETYKRLEIISKRRNFWVHNCYFDLIFDNKTGGLKKSSDIKILMEDFSEAESMRNLLFEEKVSRMKIQ